MYKYLDFTGANKIPGKPSAHDLPYVLPAITLCWSEIMDCIARRYYMDPYYLYIDTKLGYIIDRHVNNNRHKGMQPYDYWKMSDDIGRSYVDENGRIMQDPGHSLESVGLGLAFYNL
jgi:hypothetical protein